MFTYFAEMRQPEEVGEESSILETEVKGEIHIISFLGNLHIYE